MRLPAPTLLARCSPLSKLWHNSTTKDARFAVVHNVLNRNNKSLILNLLNVFRGGIDICYFFRLEANNDNNYLHPKIITRIETHEIFELVGYANGLACIKRVSKPDAAMGSISVVNPIRFETLNLYYVTPTGGYIYLCHGFAFDSLSQVYKAVIVFTSKDDDGFVCVVITLGTLSWRNIITSTLDMSPPPGSPPFPGRMVTRLSSSFCRPATYCGGDLLWRTTSEVGNGSKMEMLLSFDLHYEKIRFIRLPAVSNLTPTMDEHQYLVIDHLLEYKGYPCIARSEKISISNSDHSGHRCEYQSNCCCKVHMYILKDRVKQVWIREETFDVQIKDHEGLLPAPLCCYFETSAVTPPTRALTLSDQVLLYWFNGESLILYNLQEKCLKVVKCSRSYPRIFQAKMNETLSRKIGDDINIDCPYMDYQLHAQVENLVSLTTFVPKGAKTSNCDCTEDLQRVVVGNLLAGLVFTGRKPFKSYAFYEDKVVGDEVRDDVQGNPNGSCSSKQSRSEKKSGKAIPK
ncbi:uncharacterized protein LOC113298941 [Papaver somniferum]|uniref:uncharacterized protein LOC113298941 n=1 Tax=Papaver somniferum TaxID=3469 RepID=UPI000E705ACF|nr:uncharacterized protein LOC113298941 [Papaver somniferum]